jgi:hypothetical protein
MMDLDAGMISGYDLFINDSLRMDVVKPGRTSCNDGLVRCRW